MNKPVLILVTGLPATGKTTLARRIASTFSLPMIHKDGIKELLFDSLGWRDRAWSRQLGVASYRLLYYFVEVQLAAGLNCIVESNFKAQTDSRKFLALQERYPFEPVQIHCVAQGQVLFERFKRRAGSAGRHPGHVDAATFAELETNLLRGWDAPLQIGGLLLEVDTTDYEKIDYELLFSTIRTYLESPAG